VGIEKEREGERMKSAFILIERRLVEREGRRVKSVYWI